MFASNTKLLVILIAILSVWFLNDYSIPSKVRRLHPKSFVAPGFERVRSKYEYVSLYYCFLSTMLDFFLTIFYFSFYQKIIRARTDSRVIVFGIL